MQNPSKDTGASAPPAALSELASLLAVHPALSWPDSGSGGDSGQRIFYFTFAWARAGLAGG